MTRYFYTDPLEAAYMVNHYGMRLVMEKDPDGLNFLGWGIGLISDCEDMEDFIGLLSEKLGERFYIHPDSLHLLEPRHRDLYLNTANSPEYWFDNCGYKWHKRYRIIQRGGKPFFWPDQEK